MMASVSNIVRVALRRQYMPAIAFQRDESAALRRTVE